MSTTISAPVSFARDAYQLAMLELLQGGTLPGNLPTRSDWLASLTPGTEVVKFSAQVLTESQKFTARTNIGADGLLVPDIPMVGNIYRLQLGASCRTLVPMASGGWYDGILTNPYYSVMLSKDGSDIWTIYDCLTGTTWTSTSATYPVGVTWTRTGGYDPLVPVMGYARVESPVLAYSIPLVRCWMLFGSTYNPVEISPETAASIAYALGYTPADNSAVVKLTGIQTVAGAKSFSGQMQLTSQAATDASSAMTRGLGDARWSRRPVVLDHDEARTNNATPSDVTMTAGNHPEGLSVFGVNLAANECVTLLLLLQVNDAAATRNQNFQFVVPSGCTWMAGLVATASGGTTASYFYGATDVLANRLASANPNGVVQITCVVTNGSTPGVCKLQFCQGSSSATTITIKKGSSMAVMRP